MTISYLWKIAVKDVTSQSQMYDLTIKANDLTIFSPQND